ncbi:MAG: flagellar basal body P-ring formation protein FlgA [Nitrospirae bacterium]|nr:flagellar basal body P-ring formation protein FlgA [Nitrospirota bacterium]
MVAFLLAALVTTWSAESVINDFLRRDYPWPEIKVELLSDASPTTGAAPNGVYLLRGSVPGRAVFVIEFPNGENVEYSANVEAFDYVVNNQRPLVKGETISAEDVYRVLVNIRRIPNGAFASEKECVGKIATHTIPANRTLTEGLVAEAYNIKKGQEVVMLYESFGVRITAKGIVKEDGYIGKPVKVMNASSRKVVLATPVDGKTVKVEDLR